MFYQLSLNQLKPQAVWKIASFIWHYQFMSYSLTLDLFRSLFKIEQGGKQPYYSAKVVNWATVIVLDLSDVKYYFDRTICVRVPLTTEQPYRYNPLVNWTTAILHPPLIIEKVRKLTRLKRYAFLNL